MEYIELGRTGLQVSVIGLGGGGHSRLGMTTNKNEQESTDIVKKSIELGINVFDTAEMYGTESRMGQGLQHANREQIYLSTKYALHDGDQLKKPKDLEKSLDQSLLKLKTDYIDIYHLHAVHIGDYDYGTEMLVPELKRMQEKGKIRFLGITEAFGADPSHKTLERAVQDDCWDVMMVGFNIVNQSARERVLKTAIAKNIGILGMFAVRRALANKEALIELTNDMLDKGLLNEKDLDRHNPLGFLLHQDGAMNLTDAAYRFCRHEPGIHCILTGTGNITHLEENIQAANRGPLPIEDVKKLQHMFASIDSVTGN